MNNSSHHEAVVRIRRALDLAVEAVTPFIGRRITAEYKSGNELVTTADRAVNRVLHAALATSEDEGWLSEESADTLSRLAKRRVWIVDPIDGTRQFVDGTPEWSISIAFVEDGQPVAGGVCNPATRETFVGSISGGLTYNGESCRATHKTTLAGALVLASRNEVERGEWSRFTRSSFKVRPLGSIAYKLARVAAGLADATWTLQPKSEWDIAAGVALIRAGGGFARPLEISDMTFNNRIPSVPNLLAGGPGLEKALPPYLHRSAPTRSIKTGSEESLVP